MSTPTRRGRFRTPAEPPEPRARLAYERAHILTALRGVALGH